MERRTFLAAVGTTATASTVGLAGCEGAPGAGADTEPPGTTPAEDTETPAGGTESPADGTATPGTVAGETTAGGTTGTAAGVTTIDMVTEGSEYYFDPIGLYVEPGSTITWRNESGTHSATAYHESIDAAQVTRIPADAEPWNSGILSEEGATFDHSFDATGTYDYFCIPHKTLGMVGRLVVGEPGGPATEGQPPDGELPSSERIVEERVVTYEEFAG